MPPRNVSPVNALPVKPPSFLKFKLPLTHVCLNTEIFGMCLCRKNLYYYSKILSTTFKKIMTMQTVQARLMHTEQLFVNTLLIVI